MELKGDRLKFDDVVASKCRLVRIAGGWTSKRTKWNLVGECRTLLVSA
jgi:hypothetical protein